MSVYRKQSRAKGGKGPPRYAVVIDLESTALGGRRRWCVGTFRTRKEADSAERKALEQRDAGVEAPSERLTVKAVITRYIARCRSKGLAPTTVVRYDELSKTLSRSLGDVLATKLKPADVTEMYAQAQAGGLSPKTVRHLHGLLHAALEWGVEMGLCVRNVASIAAHDLPKLRKSPARALTETEAQRLLGAAKGTPWHALFTLAICTGARRGELAALRWSSLDFECGRMAVERSLARSGEGVQAFKETKSGIIRTIPLNRLALAALEWHRVLQGREKKHAGEVYADQDLVFADGRGEPWNLTAITNAFARIAKAAGIQAARLHDLRHSAASWMLQSGIDIRTVSSVLGHSTPVTTLGTYAHLMPGADSKAVDAIAARLEAAIS